MSNFKHSFKKNKKVKDSKNETFDFDFSFDGDFEYSFSVERDLKYTELPKENDGKIIVTDRVRNPDDFIDNVEREEGINNLIIFASRITGCSHLYKADYVICKEGYKQFPPFYIHAKIIVVNNYVILSSANLNKTNATKEQHIIINSECLKQKITDQLKKKFKK